jgi:hypothetical protein
LALSVVDVNWEVAVVVGYVFDSGVSYQVDRFLMTSVNFFVLVDEVYFFEADNVVIAHLLGARDVESEQNATVAFDVVASWREAIDRVVVGFFLYEIKVMTNASA